MSGFHLPLCRCGGISGVGSRSCLSKKAALEAPRRSPAGPSVGLDAPGTRFSRVPRKNLARKSVRFVHGVAPLVAAASSEPASEAGDACKHIDAEPMNELRFSMQSGGRLKTRPTSFLIAYRLWSKTPTSGESLRTGCSRGDCYCASSLPTSRRSLQAWSTGLFPA
jgi:hypothetical protein